MVLVLGVGYAVVSTTTLSIDGSAAAKDRQLDVVISAADPTSGTAYGTVSNPVDKTATITVTDLDIKAPNNTATVTYTITNRESDVAAKVYVGANGISNSNSTYFGASTSIDGESKAITIQPGASATMTVTVNLLAMPYESGTNTSTIGVTITADPVAAS